MSEDLRVENDRLRKEAKKLRVRIAELRDKLEDMTDVVEAGWIRIGRLKEERDSALTKLDRFFRRELDR